MITCEWGRTGMIGWEWTSHNKNWPGGNKKREKIRMGHDRKMLYYVLCPFVWKCVKLVKRNMPYYVMFYYHYWCVFVETYFAVCTAIHRQIMKCCYFFLLNTDSWTACDFILSCHLFFHSGCLSVANRGECGNEQMVGCAQVMAWQ